MQWSQLKKRIEALFADTVQGRVEFHTTRYHKAHDQMGRGWIAIDKVQIINMCDYDFECRRWQEARRLQEASGNVDYRNPAHKEGYRDAYFQAQESLRAQSVFPRWEFTSALFDYLNLPFADILKSPNPIIRAVGMLDHRMGKRRLVALDMTKEHPLAQKLYAFRCEGEGLTIRSRPA